MPHSLPYNPFRLSGADSAQLAQKKQELDKLSEQRRKFAEEFEKFDAFQHKKKESMEKLTGELFIHEMAAAGHQSEPTTPPERRLQNYSGGFPYSSSTLTSPPGYDNRTSRSGSTLTSPPSELAQTHHNHINNDMLPSKSVPNSRRGSNDRISAYNTDFGIASKRAPAA